MNIRANMLVENFTGQINVQQCIIFIGRSRYLGWYLHHHSPARKGFVVQGAVVDEENKENEENEEM